MYNNIYEKLFLNTDKNKQYFENEMKTKQNQ